MCKLYLWPFIEAGMTFVFVILSNLVCIWGILFIFPSSVIDCGDPGNPENGRRILQGGTTFQSNVTYECNPGFSLVGVSFRTCRADGTWSGSQPSCTRKYIRISRDLALLVY